MRFQFSFSLYLLAFIACVLLVWPHANLSAFVATQWARLVSLLRTITEYIRRTAGKILALELAGLLAAGATLMQLREYSLSLLSWLAVAIGVGGVLWPKARSKYREVAAVMASVGVFVGFVVWTVAYKGDDPWTNFQRLRTKKASVAVKGGSESSLPPTKTNEQEHLKDNLSIADNIDTKVHKGQQNREPMKTEHRVQLIFKDSPLFTDQRKHSISSAVDQAYVYLQNVGFAISIKLPPIGVSDYNVLATSGIYPGTVYDSQIYLPRNSIDDMDEIRKLYLIHVFRTLFHSENPENDSQTAASLFAVYYASSIAGIDLDHSNWVGRKWTDALWEIRQVEGREATDQYMYFTYLRWNEISVPDDQNFDERFKTKFLAGVWVKANGGSRLKSVMALVAKHLNAQPQRRDIQNDFTGFIVGGTKIRDTWKAFMDQHNNEHLDQSAYASEAKEWHGKIEECVPSIVEG